MFFLPAHPRPAGKRPGNAADALPARKGVLTGCGLIPARQPIMTCNSNISIHSAGDAAQPFRIRSVRYRGDRKKKKEKRKKKKEKRKKKKEKRKKKKEKRKKKKEKRKKKKEKHALAAFCFSDGRTCRPDPARAEKPAVHGDIQPRGLGGRHHQPASGAGRLKRVGQQHRYGLPALSGLGCLPFVRKGGGLPFYPMGYTKRPTLPYLYPRFLADGRSCFMGEKTAGSLSNRLIYLGIFESSHDF
ncbi:hypothetical protein [Neisseria musculi]|uniref:hypothetical protein n=1 Tax=Neisseria musculi TaxID=1815583 RepID=UPI003F880E56